MKYLFIYNNEGKCVSYCKYNKLVEILRTNRGYRCLVKEI